MPEVSHKAVGLIVALTLESCNLLFHEPSPVTESNPADMHWGEKWASRF
jgi:hypothetical protein